MSTLRRRQAMPWRRSMAACVACTLLPSFRLTNVSPYSCSRCGGKIGMGFTPCNNLLKKAFREGHPCWLACKRKAAMAVASRGADRPQDPAFSARRQMRNSWRWPRRQTLDRMLAAVEFRRTCSGPACSTSCPGGAISTCGSATATPQLTSSTGRQTSRCSSSDTCSPRWYHSNSTVGGGCQPSDAAVRARPDSTSDGPGRARDSLIIPAGMDVIVAEPLALWRAHAIGSRKLRPFPMRPWS